MSELFFEIFLGDLPLHRPISHKIRAQLWQQPSTCIWRTELAKRSWLSDKLNQCTKNGAQVLSCYLFLYWFVHYLWSFTTVYNKYSLVLRSAFTCLFFFLYRVFNIKSFACCSALQLHISLQFNVRKLEEKCLLCSNIAHLLIPQYICHSCGADSHDPPPPPKNSVSSLLLTTFYKIAVFCVVLKLKLRFTFHTVGREQPPHGWGCCH